MATETIAQRNKRLMERMDQSPKQDVVPPKTVGPTTAVGQKYGVVMELDSLKKRLRELEQDKGAAALIDSELIHPTIWANRHPGAFENADFSELCQQIEHTKGNIQPILVQPKLGSPGEYEIIYGHRRHRANLKLGFKTRANVLTEPLSSEALFALMDAENRGRANPSMYEQGLSYHKALEQGVYSSAGALSKALGVSAAWVSQALGLVRLDPVILGLFANPLEIKASQAKRLRDLVGADEAKALERAKEFEGERLSVDAVIKLLQGEGRESRETSRPVLLPDGRQFATFKRESSGAQVIKIKQVLTPEQMQKIVNLLDELAKG